MERPEKVIQSNSTENLVLDRNKDINRIVQLRIVFKQKLRKLIIKKRYESIFLGILIKRESVENCLILIQKQTHDRN